MQRLKNYLHESKRFKQHITKATLVLIILLIFLIIRLFNLQISNYQLHADLALQNQLTHISIEPNRGLIYDRNGILLAENIPTFSLEIAPKHVKNLSATINKLKNIVTISSDDTRRFYKLLTQHQRLEYLPLKFKLTQEELATLYVNQYHFPGVMIASKMIRYYPLADDVVSVLGYVGIINKQELKNIPDKNYNVNDIIGKVGIEKHYESKLHGKMGYKIVEVDAGGHITRTVKIVPPIPGESIYLTIDSQMQKIARTALDKENGAVVAIDPNNGEILALVSNPSYDPNLFTAGIDNTTFQRLQSSKNKPLHNRAIRSAFPLGSTIKPFLALQGLDTKIINPDFKISDPGWFKLENSSHVHRDWIYNGHGIVNITKAIIQSCNTFFYTLAIKLGIEKMAEMLEKFGFGKTLDIDIAEESSGIVATPQWLAKRIGRRWYPGDTVVAGIGQGYMSTTPLQLAHGTATIAMRGIRYQPHLLLATQATDGTKNFLTPNVLPAVTLKNKAIWDIIISAMQGVITSPYGTAHRRFGYGYSYSVAGKTGTVQLYHHKTVNENPTPESEINIPKHLRNHSLFIAFAPIDDPKIALAVVVENNKIAPQVARKILDYYLGVNPDISSANITGLTGI